MKQLTIIIPFLNEKIEVENTLKSIFSHTSEDVDIIVINDFSDDGYDYDSLEKKYNIIYIKNKKRLGVASCRNLGVSKSTTKYFLLLDAHMRFYDSNWYSILMDILINNPRTMLCCQSRAITRICGVLSENVQMKAYGAYIFIDDKRPDFMEVRWNLKNNVDKNSHLMEIPCVLGAGYAGEKLYWEKLHGLEGLYSYGLDEQFLSLKVWLEGGKCLLVDDIVIGHIYRTFAPYDVNVLCMMYNKMLIIELLMPTSIKYRYFNMLKSINSENYNKSLSMLESKREWINQQRAYFENIFERNYEDIVELNKRFMEKENSNDKTYNEIKPKITTLLSYTYDDRDLSITSGLCGRILVFLLWARITKNELFEEIAESLINQLYGKMNWNTNLTFQNGLLGIGWLFEFLIQNHLIDSDGDDTLKELDDVAQSFDVSCMPNNSFSFGVRGIVAYVVARMRSVIKNSSKIPFKKEFLQKLYKVCKNIILYETNIKSSDYEIEFVEMIESNFNIKQINILGKNDLILIKSNSGMCDKTLIELAIKILEIDTENPY